MYDALWSLKQRSASLDNFLSDNQSMLNDSAIRKIQTFFLNPYHDDNEQMIQDFEAQYETIDHSKMKIESAEKHRSSALAAEQKVTMHLDTSEEQLHHAISELEIFTRYNRTAQSQFPQVQQLIEQANTVCG